MNFRWHEICVHVWTLSMWPYYTCVPQHVLVLYNLCALSMCMSCSPVPSACIYPPYLCPQHVYVLHTCATGTYVTCTCVPQGMCIYCTCLPTARVYPAPLCHRHMYNLHTCTPAFACTEHGCLHTHRFSVLGPVFSPQLVQTYCVSL